MFTTGIVSVTFRQKSMGEIIALCRQTGLDSIEVGSDVHAPKDDLTNCRAIADEAKAAGITVASYGSYYKLGQYPDAAAEFTAYIDAAKALGAPNIRIWAGVKNSQDVDEAKRAELVREAQLCADLASKAGLTMSFEYHGGTLTNESDSAVRLMREINRENVHLYWQPNQYHDLEFNLTSLRAALPYVSNVHVFAWDARSGTNIRYPLIDHANAWGQYLDILAADGRNHALLMEFVKDDADEHFLADAAVLKEWSNKYAL